VLDAAPAVISAVTVIVPVAERLMQQELSQLQLI